MKLSVVVRVAGHTKSSYTYLQLLEDLVDVVPGPACLLEAGFVDYKMVFVAIDLPPQELDRQERDLFCELAEVELRFALKTGIGIDPRQMSGRLCVIVESEVAGAGTAEEVAERMRGRSAVYRVEVLDGGFSG